MQEMYLCQEITFIVAEEQYYFVMSLSQAESLSIKVLPAE